MYMGIKRSESILKISVWHIRIVVYRWYGAKNKEEWRFLLNYLYRGGETPIYIRRDAVHVVLNWQVVIGRRYRELQKAIAIYVNNMAQLQDIQEYQKRALEAGLGRDLYVINNSHNTLLFPSANLLYYPRFCPKYYLCACSECTQEDARKRWGWRIRARLLHWLWVEVCTCKNRRCKQSTSVYWNW